MPIKIIVKIWTLTVPDREKDFLIMIMKIDKPFSNHGDAFSLHAWAVCYPEITSINILMLLIF